MLPECVICLEGLDPYEENAVIVTTICGHLFHEQCIMTWINQWPLLARCPQCREWMYLTNYLQRVFLTIPDKDVMGEELAAKLLQELRAKDEKLAALHSGMKAKEEERMTLMAKAKNCDKLKLNIEKRDNEIQILKERLKKQSLESRQKLREMKARCTSAERDKNKLEKELLKIEREKAKAEATAARAKLCQEVSFKTTSSRKRKTSEQSNAPATKEQKSRPPASTVAAKTAKLKEGNNVNGTKPRSKNTHATKPGGASVGASRAAEKPKYQIPQKSYTRSPAAASSVATVPALVDYAAGCTSKTGAIPKVRKLPDGGKQN